MGTLLIHHARSLGTMDAQRREIADGALFARDALLPDGWARDVLLAWNSDGVLVEVQHGRRPVVGVAQAAGPLVPGLTNLHSRAFERVIAGLDETQADARDRLGAAARAVTPVQLEDIATHLYIEMLKAGYTSVCEFQALHHDPAGRRYANPAEMSLRLITAARLAGIGLTLLPVLCTHGGFGAAPPRAAASTTALSARNRDAVAISSMRAASGRGFA